MRNSIRLWNRKVNAKQFNLRWRVLAILPTLLSLLMSVPSAPAQRESDNIELVGRALMGTINAVAVDENIAYLGTGAGLLVLDVTDPANPRELSRLFLPVVVSDVALSGGLLFVAGGTELRILDVSDPTHPEETGIFRPSSGYFDRLAIDGSLVYVSGDLPLLRILDVSDPRQPRQVGQISDERFHASPTSVAIAGRTAYVGNGRRFHIIDISNPTRPQGQGLLELAGDAVVYDIAVMGDVSYAAAGRGNLRIVEISDPTHPREVRGFGTAINTTSVTITGRYAYVAASGKLQVLDVSDLLAPRELRVLNLPDAQRVTLSGNLAYIAARASMAIVDVTDPTNPVQRGSFVSSGFAWSVTVSDGMAYVADALDGLRIVEVSDPAHPRERGAVRGFPASDVAVSGSFAYVTYFGLGKDGLLIFDVSDPDQPVERSRLPLSQGAVGITVSDSLAYVADGRAGLRIIDVADPDHPQEVGCFDTPGFAFDVVVSGTVAYVADYDGGLLIINVGDPGNPRELGFDATYRFSHLASSSNMVYAGGDQGLGIFDVSQPARPQLLAFLDPVDVVHRPLSLAAAGDLAIVGTWVDLRVWDVSTPSVPTERAVYEPPASAFGVALADGLIYVADAQAGLLILTLIDVSLQANPPITRMSTNGEVGNGRMK